MTPLYRGSDFPLLKDIIASHYPTCSPGPVPWYPGSKPRDGGINDNGLFFLPPVPSIPPENKKPCMRYQHIQGKQAGRFTYTSVTIPDFPGRTPTRSAPGVPLEEPGKGIEKL